MSDHININVSQKQAEVLKNFNFTLNPGQLYALNFWSKGKHLFLNGPAGTGKTWISFLIGLDSILSKNHSKFIVVRSLTQTRNIGFLPGEVEEKQKPFFDFYGEIIFSILTGLKKPGDFKRIIDKHIVFTNTSFLRGKTWDNSIVLVDEVQNLTPKELHTVMTRVGQNSMVILSGDYYQTDIPLRESCFEKLELAISTNNLFEQVLFYNDDVVRSEFVREWCENFEPIIYQ